MSTPQEQRQPSIHAVFTIGLGAAQSQHGKPGRLVQMWLSSSECRPLTLVRPFMMSEGEPESTTFESKSDKPFLYSIHSTVPRSGKSYITRLPNELLQKCFEYLTEADIANDEHRVYTAYYPQFKTGTRYRSAWAISLTCKRFSQLFKPSLYADVNLIISGHWNRTEMVRQGEEKLWRRVHQFHRSMKESPQLRQLCQVLAVDLDMFAQLARSCENSVFFDKTRSLVLYCLGSAWGDEIPSDSHVERTKSAWPYCQTALRRISALQELTLVGGELRFGHLTGIIGDLKGLKTLTLWGVKCPESRDRPPSPTILEQRKASDRAALPPPDRKGTATFTELNLQNFSSGSPYALKNFLHWPESLEVLTIGLMGIGDYPLGTLVDMGVLAYPWTFNLLTDVLHCHRSTLRELRLGQMATQEGLDTFDLHKFPCLEILQICTGGLPAAEQAAGLWVTPKLKRLVLESSHEDSQTGKYYYFRPEQVDWLDEFARLAAYKKRDEEVGLMSIEVLYETSASSSWAGEPDGNYQPVEDSLKPLFLRAKELVERHGIEFVCPTNISPSCRALDVGDSSAEGSQ